MPAASIRPLVTGTGTVTVVAGSKYLVFTAYQAFKEGASVMVDPTGTAQPFTIDTGSGTVWQVMQTPAFSTAGVSFLRSNESCILPAARARGGANSSIHPNAAHFAYRSPLDDAGDPDFYTYFDTLFPENGMHPYTNDPYVGTAGMSSLTTGRDTAALIPDLSTRMRRIEGALRAHATPGTTLDPDKRLRALEERIRLLEAEPGGPGATATVTYTLQQLTDYGDPA